jgi:(S)-3,5-dihydroxyphenylglycine transaminase
MILTHQDYNMYSEDDHHTWSKLTERQTSFVEKRASKVFLEAFKKMDLDKKKVVNIQELSSKLEAISGWSLIPVSGLIPTRDFFYMLINKKYPVTVYIRKPHEIEFSEQPDIFHDVFGHLPLLTNEKFTQFLTAYSTIAIKYVSNERAIELLGRLYWYTYEMGLLLEDGQYKPYGGAVITSSEEVENVGRADISKNSFDIDDIFNTAYNPYKLQSKYFVIQSFDMLFDCIEGLEQKLIDHLLIRQQDFTLRNYSLNNCIGKDFNNVIGFLNDVQYKFPDAISFVAGQPDEMFFDIENNLSKFNVFVEYQMHKTGKDRRKVINNIGQYNKTKGIINEIVAEYLKKDDNINIKPEHILITVGAQEAFSIIVSTICNRDNDIILVEDPSYIGVSSFSKVFDYNIHGVPVEDEGIDLHKLKNKILEFNSKGKRVKLVYVIPDYQNPSGCSMPIGNRLKLLDMAQQYNFLIIEDSVYNSFTYAQRKTPTLKSMDKYNRVVYVSSFSKSLFPGLRIGLIGADQKIENELGQDVFLIDEMVKVKAQLTNNTPTINQAILGGILLSENYTLGDLNKAKYVSYKKKRNKIVDALNEYIRNSGYEWAGDIRWNEPEGGFFIKMVVPFNIDADTVIDCAKRFDVIICPMRNFYLENGGFNEIRLTFSNLSLDEIDTGIKRLALFLNDKITAGTVGVDASIEVHNYQ